MRWRTYNRYVKRYDAYEDIQRARRPNWCLAEHTADHLSFYRRGPVRIPTELMIG
jgi:hypothetical protein